MPPTTQQGGASNARALFDNLLAFAIPLPSLACPRLAAQMMRKRGNVAIAIVLPPPLLARPPAPSS